MRHSRYGVSFGCQVAQGYFLSRPIAATDLQTWVAEVGPSWLASVDHAYLDEATQQRIIEAVRGALSA